MLVRVDVVRRAVQLEHWRQALCTCRRSLVRPSKPLPPCIKDGQLLGQILMGSCSRDETMDVGSIDMD